MFYGFGLIKGLYVTAKRLFSRKVTQQYPDVLPDLPPRSHGSFGFDADKCIACNLCANACPNGVIRVDTFKDQKGKNQLDTYRMNLGYCLFCGQCVEACPKDALYFKTEFNLACYNKGDTLLSFRGNTYKPEVAAESSAAVPAAKQAEKPETKPATEPAAAKPAQGGQGVAAC